MYELEPAHISKINNDSCFIDIEIAQGKRDNFKLVSDPSIAIKSISYYEKQQTQQSKQQVSQRHSVLNIDMIPEEAENSSIWSAAESGNLETLKYLVTNYKQKAKERESKDEEREDNDEEDDFINQRDPSTECTLLYTVIIANSNNPYPYIKLLLEHGADATARNIYNIQAIHALLLHCPEPLESLQLLLDHDADPNARDGDGWSSVHYAARFCSAPEPILRLLFKKGAEINALDYSNKRTALFGLLANGDHGKTLDWLIHDAKATVKIRADFSNQKKRGTVQGTLILQACKYGRLSCLRILISSASVMESLIPLVTEQELEMAMELINQQLRKAKEREAIEQLTIMASIIKDLKKKLFPVTEITAKPATTATKASINVVTTATDVEDIDITEPESQKVQRKPSLLKRFLMNSPF